MRVILIPIGSSGDVFPFLGLGQRLASRGHEIVVITNGHFRGLVESLGFAYDEFGSDEQYRQALNNPDLWHPVKGFKTVMAMLADQAGLMGRIRAHLIADTVVVAHSLAFGAIILQEKEHVPVVSLTLQPAMLRSLDDGPVIMGNHGVTRWPRVVRRAYWWLADRLVIDPLMAKMIDPLRDELGLPRVRRFFKQWIFSPRLNIGMFPHWFASPQPDWPANTHLTGFPLCDAFDPAIPPRLESLLSRGERPIVFTAGTANVHAQRFFQAAADACRRLGRPGILLTRHRQQIPTDLLPGVEHFDFAPLSRILPRCGGLVHHGGIGTTGAGFAGGVPQVIMPLSHDQPDNAARVVRLGTGDRLWPKRFTGPNLAACVKPLLDSTGVAARCADYAKRCAQVDALDQAASLIEGAAPVG